MSLVSWLFSNKDYKTEVIDIPMPMNHALETVMYLNNLEKEEVILVALEDYLIKNVYAIQESGQRTKFKRMKQLR